MSANEFTLSESHEFVIPSKSIKSPADMITWEKSEAYSEYLGFILAMNEAVQGLPNSLEGITISENVNRLLAMMDVLDKLICETPPIEQPQRFGNQAFRLWYHKLNEQAFTLIQSVLPDNLHRSIPEIMCYLIEGFGNPTRIDYGTGHEISFLMFLCCLFKINFLKEEDKPAVPCKVFAKYLYLVRKLQQTYRMEPAGSHGVWSLDDYQFVPFIWGSSQLINHPRIEPPSFLQQEIVDEYADEYLFLGCIQYINQVKTGPFAEHSNQLWGISGVSSWSKINGGLIKMYKVEVLGKFPVVQHILFGSLLSVQIAQRDVISFHKKRMSLTPPSTTSTSTLKELSAVSQSAESLERDAENSTSQAKSQDHV